MRTFARELTALANQRERELGDHNRAWGEIHLEYPDLWDATVAAGRRPGTPGAKPKLALANEAEAARARDLFIYRVKDRMRDQQLPYEKAYVLEEKASPDLIALANSTGPSDRNSGGPAPTTGPGNALFGLWPGTDQKYVDAAYKANGSHMPPPMDAGKVFEAICNVIADERGIDLEKAIPIAKDMFPELWKLTKAAAR